VCCGGWGALAGEGWLLGGLVGGGGCCLGGGGGSVLGVWGFGGVGCVGWGGPPRKHTQERARKNSPPFCLLYWTFRLFIPSLSCFSRAGAAEFSPRSRFGQLSFSFRLPFWPFYLFVRPACYGHPSLLARQSWICGR